MRVISLNVGMPILFEVEGKPVQSGIFKQPIHGPVYLGAEQLDGDGQADRVNHGGPDKAVCAYFADHYPYWEKKLNRKLEWGAFGENFTIAGAKEAELYIGDTYRIGEAIVQVSQPRQPCHKLAKKHGVQELPLYVQMTGYTGFYFRVMEEGFVESGQQLELIEKHPAAISLAYANTIKYEDKADVKALRLLSSLDVLSESWRKSFVGRLAQLESK